MDIAHCHITYVFYQLNHPDVNTNKEFVLQTNIGWIRQKVQVAIVFYGYVNGMDVPMIFHQ